MKRTVCSTISWFACIAFSVGCAAPGLEERTEDSPPTVNVAVAPVYPLLAAQGHIGGEVVVEVNLDQRGGVSSGTVQDGHPLLRDSALWAAERWTFKPGSAGRKVKLKFVFNLVPTASDSKDLASAFRPPYEVESKARLPQAVVNYDSGNPHN